MKNTPVSKELGADTLLVHGCSQSDRFGAISYPIYQTATFKHNGIDEEQGYDYSRQQNPTREVLEQTVAALEGGSKGCAFTSGMAAIAAVFELFNYGDHIIVSDDLYGGTYRFLKKFVARRGIDITYVDTTAVDNIKNALNERTKAILLETPSNPMMKVSDIEAIRAVACSDILLIVDNTFLSPYLQKPITFGADIVIHSGTKYLGGHNDTLSGFVVTADSRLGDIIAFVQKSTGAALSPFDSWLILRGIKTLGIRLDRQQSNAQKIADWLLTQDTVSAVYYPGLSQCSGFDISKKQSNGFGAMISFRLKDSSRVDDVLRKCKLISYAESLGGVESLITYPLRQTHVDIPLEIRNKLGIDESLLRLSVGIESIEDLIDDLETALNNE